jgi:hypothetical protein
MGDYSRPGHPVADRAARGAVFGVPLLVGAATAVAELGLGGADAVLAAVALLAGGFLAAFTHLSGVRARLTEREVAWGDAERVNRDALDETSAHLIAASYISGAETGLIIILMNLAGDGDGGILGPWAGLAYAGLAYLLIVFMIALPRLYTAYAESNSVRPELNGLYKG